MIKTREVIETKTNLLETVRAYLLKRDFLEIHTPKISFMPTDQENHLFHTNYFGKESYLVQSPQFYKQAYIINGIHSVFEIGPVFRAEDRVTNRHLSEFISIDIESSRFKKLDDILKFEAELLKKVSIKLSSQHELDPILTFDVVKYRNLKKLLKLKEGESIGNKHEEAISRLFKSDGIFIIEYPKNERVFYYEEENGLSLSYDLIVKGLEITSGGIRTRDREKLLRKMREIGIDPKKYMPYLKLFEGSVPIHGGFGIGLERLLSRYLNIKDVSKVNPYSKKPNTFKEDLIWKG